jgi:hypothetical protein
MMTNTELRASVLRGCATAGQAWALMALSDAEFPDTTLEVELDNVLLALAGNLALRRDRGFCEVAKSVILENAARAVVEVREASGIVLH